MLRLQTFGLALLALLASSAAVQAVELTGSVRGPDGYLLAGTSVSVRDTSFSTLTDESGHFRLTGNFAGPITLIATRAGFKAAEKLIPANLLGIGVIEIVMQVAPLLQAIQVEGKGPPSESPSHVELNLLEIVSTAGTDADPLRAVQMLPGMVKVDEGAGLYLDGGDVGEVATYINRALVPHPYRYETPTGGLFGSVDPFFIEGISLNTAGFPARFGNALSGVLDLHMMPKPVKTSLFANVGLASSSADATVSLGDHFGFRVAANKSFTGLLFAVNQPSQHFSQNPNGYDASSAFYFNSKSAGNFTGYFYRAADQTGVEVQQGTFTGDLSSAETKSLMSGSWQRPIGHGWTALVGLSHSSLDEATHSGVALNLVNTDHATRMRLDALGPFAGGLVRVGADFEDLHFLFNGSTPKVANDLAGNQGVNIIKQEAATEDKFGTYVEYERTLGRFTLNAGLRSDGYRKAKTRDYDPRLSVEYALTPRQNLRVAWGTYHQAPSAFYLDPFFGNPRLGLMASQHMVVGYAYGEESGAFFVRVSVYNKRYTGLPSQSVIVNFDNTGAGYARGVDTLVKARFGRNWDGWVGYSLLSAKRRWTPLEDVNVFTGTPQLAPPSFDIPHTLQMVVHGKLPASLSFGATFRIASGKPFTPVVSAKEITSTFFLPAYGPENSQRLPVYQRLDLNLSRPFRVTDKVVVMPYLGVSNALGHHNIFNYAYSIDYTERHPAVGTVGRTFYVGMIFQL
jgi:vitamin B12 transporter